MGEHEENGADGEPGRGPVKSAERTVRILQALAPPPYVLSVAQLQERTGYPRSSLHALLRTLVDLRWIEPPAGPTGGYGIGSQALLTGTAYLDRDPALPSALAAVEAVRDETPARRTSPVWTPRERRVPRDAGGAGRAPDPLARGAFPAGVRDRPRQGAARRTVARELDALLPGAALPPLTPDTVPDRASLDAELDEVRRRGWAVERGQNLPGTVCVGVGWSTASGHGRPELQPARRPGHDAEVERVAGALVRAADRLARDPAGGRRPLTRPAGDSSHRAIGAFGPRRPRPARP